MTTEFDLIRRYRGAFTEQQCNKFIDFIENFDQHNILVHDKENLHQVNHKTANVQLEQFSKNKLKHYGRLRNFDFGNQKENFISSLSPAITRRIINEKLINQDRK